MNEEMKCTKCGSSNVVKNGFDRRAAIHYQKIRCKECGRECYIPLNKENQITKPMQTKIGITLDEFRQKHDLNFIVSSVLKQLDDKLVYQKEDIIRLCKLRPGYPGLSSVLESKEYENYNGRAGGQIYWGTIDTIRKLKNQGLLT